MSLSSIKSTINGIIEEGKHKKLMSETLCMKEVLVNSSDKKFVVNWNYVYEKYYDILLDHVVTVKLTDTEYFNYRYQPKKLAMDLYGNKDLYFLLLRVNYIYSIINFDFKELKVFDSSIISLINEILILESESYIDNELSVIREINE